MTAQIGPTVYTEAELLDAVDLRNAWAMAKGKPAEDAEGVETGDLAAWLAVARRARRLYA